MSNPGQTDVEIRAVLLKEARALMAENANFSLNTLLTRTNLSRAEFSRCFNDKTELLSALADEDVRGLGEILEAAQPAAQSLRQVVNGGPAPAAVPAGDQWLERRLRVFERALMGLEKRQDKSEQTLTQAIARVQEKLDVLVSGPAVSAKPEISEPVVAVPEPKRTAKLETPVTTAVLPDLFAEQGMAEPLVAAPQAEPEAAPVPENSVDEPIANDISLTADEAAPVLVQEEKEQEPASEQEIHDFIAHARQAVRNAAASAEASPPPKVRKSPWLAWGIAAAVLLLLSGVGLFFASSPLKGGVPMAGAGTIHRQVAQQGLPRMIALADNGNVGAETLLALAYLKGTDVVSDDVAALRWSQAAAVQGQPVAQYVLGTLYLQNKQDVDAAHWFAAAAAQGNIKAMHNLAIAYAQGQGMAQDPAQAVTWFVRAAERGYHDSEFDLGVMYERGMGVKQDATAALKWYLIAAARGDAPSTQRAEFLQTQMNASEIRAATDEAAAFVVQPVGMEANQVDTKLVQG